MPPHVFALDETALAYAGFTWGERGLELAEVHRLALAAELLVDTPPGRAPRDVESFAARVAELLERIAAPVSQASLVLPDAWLRLAFFELPDLPREARERDEVLRFKLKRLVPFKVDELRLAVRPLPPLSGQREKLRLLTGFAHDRGLARLEEAFLRHGVLLGQVTSAALASGHALLEPQASGGVLLLAADEHAYSLTGWLAGEPVVHRHKALAAEWDEATRALQVERELRLTATFLAESCGEITWRRRVVAAPRAAEPFWVALVERAFGAAERLRAESLPLTAAAGAVAWEELLPMIGAASEVVA